MPRAAGSGPAVARQYRIAEAAERLGFAYIAPSGRGWGWTRPLSRDSLRLRAAIEEAIEAGVDGNRVYVMGISLGGYMVRELPGRPIGVFSRRRRRKR